MLVAPSAWSCRALGTTQDGDFPVFPDWSLLVHFIIYSILFFISPAGAF